MIRRGIPIIAMTTIVLALVSAAQTEVGTKGGPVKFGPKPEQPFGPGQPSIALREYAELLRARAREAQELAERLYGEAEKLDRLVKAQVGPVKGAKEPDPGQRQLMEAKEQIQRLRNEAVRAKGEGRFDESQRLWNESQNIEMKLMREQEIRRMAEKLGAMKQKAAIVRQQSIQAKQDGRHEEAKELWEKARKLEQDLPEGLEKIERFKVESQIKDRQMMAERAKKQGDDQKTKALLNEARELKKPAKIKPKESPQDSDMMRLVEELRGEVQQLRRELEEVKMRSGASRPM